MPASPPPSLPPSFPHMVLIRSGLRDSSQRKWLCTESFCAGEEGEGEREERKKERKEGRGWGWKVGGSWETPAYHLTLLRLGLSCSTPSGNSSPRLPERGAQKKIHVPLGLRNYVQEKLAAASPFPELLGTLWAPSCAGCQGPWSHLRASPGQRPEPSGVYWLSPHCAKETGEATTLNSKDNPYNSASQWFQDPEWVIWPELFRTCA